MKLPTLLIVDDDDVVAEMLEVMLRNAGYEVRRAASGEEALQQIYKAPPDALICDVLLPGIDGYTLCKRVRQHPLTKTLPILMLTAQGDISAKIAGFEAGANDYLAKPFEPPELVYRVKNLLARTASEAPSAPLRRGKIIAVFGAKGGVGKTTIAVSLALAIRLRTRQRVIIVDADLTFGDIAVHLNIAPTRSIVDIVRSGDEIEREMVNQVLLPHPSGLQALLAPPRPEEAELVSPDHITRILDLLAVSADYVVVDCQTSYDDRTLSVFDRADHVLLVITPEIGPLKNTSLFLNLANQLGINPNAISVVLNRANSGVGIGVGEIERVLRRKINFHVISGGQPVVTSVNRGMPLILDQPKHPFVQQMLYLGDQLVKQLGGAPAPQTTAPAAG
ncbi:response regulator receiver protein [Chloroflexus islandicus]|uniref:Response regulator receiver protein n=1 Tax=Chloroflexus islandicus TaxID=1707952 RepID=A0A178MCI9_9CHLR|nr:response regulator [Chloroflexus islandicus]OAN45748.1 response regulator receiver protein [Chloroflexus islandicus]